MNPGTTSTPAIVTPTSASAIGSTTRAVLLFACACAGLLASNAFAENNDIVPAKVQSDSQMSVWANNASLDLFVEQLASLTGRNVSIEGDLQGEVSGSFNGSLRDTLSEVSEQFPILFDLDDKMLGVVPVAMSERQSIAFNDTVLDAPMQKAMLVDLLPGNAVQFDDENEQVIVSGHPDFVERTVARVGLAMAEANPQNSAIVDSDEDNEPAESPTIDQEIVATGDDQIQPVSEASGSADGTIRWVTDIPGFDTF